MSQWTRIIRCKDCGRALTRDQGWSDSERERFTGEQALATAPVCPGHYSQDHSRPVLVEWEHESDPPRAD